MSNARVVEILRWLCGDYEGKQKPTGEEKTMALQIAAKCVALDTKKEMAHEGK